MSDQTILFSLLGIVFALLIWGRVRYDVVAFGALIVAIVSGVIPQDQAFNGFGHPATIIIALVLIVSRGLSNSGAVEIIAKVLIKKEHSLTTHIGFMSVLAAGLSAVMNNVAALALLMPVDMQAAAKAKRTPALTLMPLSFASILGGLITLIGTPPNIIIASFRGQALGEPFGMFDFAPTGLVVTIAGLAFIVTVGWRLIPNITKDQGVTKSLFEIQQYIAEVKVAVKSSAIGQRVRDLDDVAEESDVVIIGLVRKGKQLPGRGRLEEIKKGDLLVIETHAANIDAFVGALGLEYVGGEKHDTLIGEDFSLIEVVVPDNARIVGRTAIDLRLQYRQGVSLLGVSRAGKAFKARVRKLVIKAGDVLLLLGPSDRLQDVTTWLGGLPLQERDLQVVQRSKVGIAVGSFVAAILLASLGVINLAAALGMVCLVMVGFNIVPLRDLYTSIEWPVIVLLGSMIPLGHALEVSGGTGMIASGLLSIADGYAPVVILTLLMIVTMTLSDVLNNTATAVIAAPIAIDVASRLQVNPDPFLMAVAVAASCAFLTPIGHKNNTLVMGPGGYRFGDYWRMGLPLEIIVIVVSVPVILIVWPF